MQTTSRTAWHLPGDFPGAGGTIPMFVDGRWVPRRRLAGDDTIEGDSLQLRWPLGSKVPLWAQRRSAEGIQHFTLYRFR